LIRHDEFVCPTRVERRHASGFVGGATSLSVHLTARQNSNRLTVGLASESSLLTLTTAMFLESDRGRRQLEPAPSVAVVPHAPIVGVP
jgi:hypothetical protein